MKHNGLGRVVVVFAGALLAFGGCTTILGDFDVAPAGVSDEGGSQQQQQQPEAGTPDAAVVYACSQASDCPALPMQPATCAFAECKDQKCVWTAVDNDGDGHATAGCTVGGQPIAGDDCADDDPVVFPGGPCSKRPDGSDIVFPNGTPLGACKAGAWDCTTGKPVCQGAVAPAAQEDCVKKNDANCDGVPDDGCDCTPNTTGDCGDVNNLPLPCKKGTRQCSPEGKWGACTGDVEPKARDCSTNVDNDCNGQVDSKETACSCPGGVAQGQSASCTDTSAKGVCQNGSHLCQPSADKQSGVFGACTPSAPSTRQCGSPLDYDCNGISDELDVGCGTPCKDPLGSGAIVAAAQKFNANMYGCAARRGWDVGSQSSVSCASGWFVCSAATWSSYIRSAGSKAPTHKYWVADHLGWGGAPPSCYVPAASSTACGTSSSMTVCPYAANGATVTDAENNTCNWSGCSYGSAYSTNDYFGGCSGDNTGGSLCCR